MKSISKCKVIQVALLCVLLLVPLGCSTYDQMGETAAEGRRRHERNLRINSQQLMADFDMLILLDKPSKLTEKRIP